jgi:hypothetical protein
MDDLVLYGYIEKFLREKFEFLTQFGYGITSINYNCTNRYSGNNDLEIIFSNIILQRSFKILYMHKGGAGGDEIINNFSFSMESLTSNLFISDYMRFIHLDEIKYLWLNSFEGSFDEQLEQLLDYTVDILQTYLMPIIKGEEWIDLPTNWYGAK